MSVNVTTAVYVDGRFVRGVVGAGRLVPRKLRRAGNSELAPLIRARQDLLDGSDHVVDRGRIEEARSVPADLG